MPSSSEVFARTITVLQPYAADVVFVGGWVHALYLADAKTGGTAIRTDDIDVTIPHRLLGGDRPALLDLVSAAGYQVREVLGSHGTVEIFQPGPGQSVIDLDLLTEAPDPRQEVVIEGQPNLKVQGYPGQHILLDNARWIEVGAEVHPMLGPAVRIRVPTLAAYVLGKDISSQARTRSPKRAKDLVYLLEIVRHPVLGRDVVGGMRAMAAKYPREYARWRGYLAGVSEDTALLMEIGEQLAAGSRIAGSLDHMRRTVAARLRRLLGETPK